MVPQSTAKGETPGLPHPSLAHVTTIWLTTHGTGTRSDWRPSHVYVRNVRTDDAWQADISAWIPAAGGTLQLQAVAVD